MNQHLKLILGNSKPKLEGYVDAAHTDNPDGKSISGSSSPAGPYVGIPKSSL